MREWLVDLMPLEHAPAHVRLAFHDAATYDASSQSGGAHGTIRLRAELQRGANAGWAHACLELISDLKAMCPNISWADLIALGGAAAIQKCDGPTIELGLGRVDGDTEAPPNRLPGGFEDATLLKRKFARMGLTVHDLVALSGAHVLVTRSGSRSRTIRGSSRMPTSCSSSRLGAARCWQLIPSCCTMRSCGRWSSCTRATRRGSFRISPGAFGG